MSGERGAATCAIAVAALLGAGCGTAPFFPATQVERELYPGLADKDESEIRAVLDAELELREPISAALIWVDQVSEGPGRRLLPSRWSEFERSGVIDAALRTFRRPPFGRVTLVPSVRARGEAGVPDLRALRSASAQLQGEAAIVLHTAVFEPRDRNPLAITWLALAPVLFVPGWAPVAYASAETCAIDVRSGVMLACSTGRASARDPYALLWSLDRVKRELRERAIAQAVEQAASRLGEAVHARLH